MILATAIGKTISTRIVAKGSTGALELTLAAQETATLPVFKVQTNEAQLRGPAGNLDDLAELISSDPSNALTQDGDGKLLVTKQSETDFLAIYLLNRGT